MEKKLLIMILIAVFAALKLFAQQKTPALHIGDKMPDITLKMINYPKPTARLSDFKGKWVILDFWSTWCSNCVAAFPKMKALQDTFAGSLVILPATAFGDAAYNKDFFAKRKSMGKDIGLPSAVEANKLFERFPFFGLPHEVWIDDRGIVRYITDDEAVTETVLRKVLKGEKVLLPEKFFDSSFNRYEPLLINGNGGKDKAFIYRSLLIPYNPRINIGLATEQNETYNRIAMGNQPPLVLIRTAVAHANPDSGFANELEYFYMPKRVILETKNPALLADWPMIKDAGIIGREQLKQEHLYTYELIVPPSTDIRSAFPRMLDDLTGLFNVTVSVEKRDVPALALIRISQEDKLMTKNKGVHDEYEQHLLVVDLQNDPLKNLVYHCNSYWKIPYIIDKTGYTGNVDLHIELQEADNLEALQKALRSYDLALVSETVTMDMLIIKDKQQ
jgi:thiol-disulfide isomerase/thioredoxin